MLFGPKPQAATVCPFLPPIPVADPVSGRIQALNYQACLKEPCIIYVDSSCAVRTLAINTKESKGILQRIGEMLVIIHDILSAFFRRFQNGLRDGSSTGSAPVPTGSSPASDPASTPDSARGNA
jgi:hypothetical protein